MDDPAGLSSFTHIIWTNLGLILIAASIVAILKVLNSILDPMNYELDMTTKYYCKSLAEIDNSIRYIRRQNGYLETRTMTSSFNNCPPTKTTLDCATDLLDGPEARSLDNNRSNSSNGCLSENSAHAGCADHVYPNGWIPIMESLKVKAGTIKKAIIFGRDVIVTRSLDGKQVAVLDAYCPHLGMHIGIGGRVKEIDNESCVECPFHKWTFRASDGHCVKTTSDKCTIPEQAKLRTWISVEVDNFIYVWHHTDGLPPNWFLTPSEELNSDQWQLAGRSYHKTNLELRDMHENGADMNHFEGIHNDLFIFGGEIIKIRPLNYLQKWFRHHWRPEWKPVTDELGKMTHKAEMKLQSWITIFNVKLFDITVRAIQLGPARVNLYYNSYWYGSGLLIMNAIPMGGRRVKYIQHIYTKRTFYRVFMAKWVLYGEIKMLERDFFIWNHKKNLSNPIFVPEDRKVKHFRKWYSQFYQRKRNIVIHDRELATNTLEKNTVPNIRFMMDF